MRIRPLVALSVAALAALTLAGCSSSSASPSASPSTSAAADLCSAQVKSGTASDAVKVSGDVGKEATVTFAKPLDVTGLQATVVKKGSGHKVKSGDIVQFALTEFNSQTGAKNGAIGQAAGSLLPQQISANSVLGQVLGCATVGTRVVATIPGDENSPATVDVVDLVKLVPSKAWGEDVAPKDGFPTVKLAKNGQPTITIPKGKDAPTTTEITTLKKGDGDTVASGDTVLVQYTGVLWTTGKVFDSSWKTGTPAQFQTTNVVKGFGKALDGATVGSQQLVVIPPADGYGDKAQGSIPANSTLVFVVDILGVQHAAAK